MADFPVLSLSPSESADARKWLAGTELPGGIRLSGSHTDAEAQALTQPELEQAISKAVSDTKGVSLDELPKSLQENRKVQLAYGTAFLARGGGISALPPVVKNSPSVIRALGGTHTDYGSRPKALLRKAVVPGLVLQAMRQGQRDFVAHWSPPGTIEKADGLPVHQREAYVAILAERILDNSPASAEVKEKTFNARIKPETALAEASEVKGFRQVQNKLPDDTRWVAFNAGQAKVEVTEKMLIDPLFSAPPGLESVNPFKGYSTANITAIASAFGVDVGDRWATPRLNEDERKSNNLAAHNVASMFGKDTEAATRYAIAAHLSANRSVRQGAPSPASYDPFKIPVVLHDAGQFTVPKGEMDKGAWSKYLAKNPEGAQFISAAPTFEKEHGRVANSVKELREFSIAKAVAAEFGADSSVLAYARHSALSGLSSRDIKEATGYRGQEKTRQDIPDIKIEGKGPAEGFTIRQLDMGDFRALTIGHESSCCQRLGGAGESCAIHSFKEPSSGVFVIENKEGELMAQTWAWTDKDKSTIVFDSVESHRSDPKVVNATAELVSALSAELGEKGIKTMLSNTSYGMTMQVADAMGLKDAHLERPPSMAVRSSYSDVNGKIYGLGTHLKERAERLAEGKQGLPLNNHRGSAANSQLAHSTNLEELISAARDGRVENFKTLAANPPVDPNRGATFSMYPQHAEALIAVKNPEIREALVGLAARSSQGKSTGWRSSTDGQQLTKAALDKGDVAFVAAVMNHPESGGKADVFPGHTYLSYLTPTEHAELVKAVPSREEQLNGPGTFQEAVNVGNLNLAAAILTAAPGLGATGQALGLGRSSFAYSNADTKVENFLKVASALDVRARDAFGAAVRTGREDLVNAVVATYKDAPLSTFDLGYAQTEKQANLVLSVLRERSAGEPLKPELGSVVMAKGNAAILVKGGVDPTHLAENAAKRGDTSFMPFLKDSGADMTKALIGSLGSTDPRPDVFKKLGADLSDPAVLNMAGSGELCSSTASFLVSQGMRVGDRTLTLDTQGANSERENQAKAAATAIIKAEPGVKIDGTDAPRLLAKIASEAVWNRDSNLAALAIGKIEDKAVASLAVSDVLSLTGQSPFPPIRDGLTRDEAKAKMTEAVVSAAIQKGTITPADFAKAPPVKEETLGQAISRIAGPEATAALYKSAQEASAVRKQAENGQEPAKTAAKAQDKGR